LSQGRILSNWNFGKGHQLKEAHNHFFCKEPTILFKIKNILHALFCTANLNFYA
jgi:hypothetical protein